MKKPNPPLDAVQLRQQAEAQLQSAFTQANPSPATTVETLRLIHELQVHQIELELQNQALLEARAQLEQSLERYADLYDFAPTGYFTLTAHGIIQEINLAGAALLGQERSRLMDRRFGLFVSTETRPAFNTFFDAVLAGTSKNTQGSLLIQLGCDLAQGYGIAYPMPPEQIPAWIAGWTAPLPRNKPERFSLDPCASARTPVKEPLRVSLMLIEYNRRNVMPLIQLIIALVILGVGLWLINNYIPMDGKIKQILNVVVVIVVILWLLSIFGLLGPMQGMRVG